MKKRKDPLEIERGKIFKRLREETAKDGGSPISQRELAEKLHIAYSGISNLENGKRDPSLVEARAYHDYFNVPLDYLFGYSNARSYENQAIGGEVGLSDEAIRTLKLYHSTDKENTFTRTVNKLLEDKDLLDKIRYYLWYEIEAKWHTEDGKPLLQLDFYPKHQNKTGNEAEPDKYVHLMEMEDIRRISILIIQNEIERLKAEIDKQ